LRAQLIAGVSDIRWRTLQTNPPLNHLPFKTVTYDIEIWPFSGYPTMSKRNRGQI
jgi:hypothetical protein